jgi:DNA end-binding protein Ku
MPHAIWKGFISFGLVNIPVVLYSAQSSSDLSFRMLDHRDGSPIKYKRINEETGKEVPWADIAKGYEYGDGQYIMVEKKDFESAAAKVDENLKTIEIEHFIQAKDLESIYFEKPYYLAPDKRGEKGYVLLREILEKTKRIAIAKVIIHTKQYYAALLPYHGGILLNVLRYPHEVRNMKDLDLPKGDIKSYKINPKEVEMGEKLVESMTVKWDPKRYHDDYTEALTKWLDARIAAESKGKKLKAPKTKETKSSSVVDFMDLLKKSVAEKKGGAKEKKAATKSTHRHTKNSHAHAAGKKKRA